MSLSIVPRPKNKVDAVSTNSRIDSSDCLPDDLDGTGNCGDSISN